MEDDLKKSLLVLMLVAAALTLGSCNKIKNKVSGLSTKSASGSEEKVTVQFFIMSQCPYGVKVVDAITPVMEKMGDNIDLKIDYIGKEPTPGTFSSMPGREILETRFCLTGL